MDILSIHRNDAIRLLEDGQRHTLRLWKLSTGDILTYHDCKCIGKHARQGIHRVQLPQSSLIREFRDVALFEIDELKIYW